MKAAIVVKPGVLRVQDLPMPEVGAYDVLCRLLYGATCTGTDQHIIRATIPFPVSYPTVLGHESIGRVVETGAKVKHFSKGDLVTRVGLPASSRGDYASNWGGFAEYGIARDHWAMARDGIARHEWNAYRVNQVLPAGMDPAAAVMVITWRETLSYLKRMGAAAGCRILVIGSGGNGLAFAAHAANLGAERVAMIGAARRRLAAESLGVTDYFDYAHQEGTSAVRERHPLGFDLIIDAVGKQDTLNAVLDLLRNQGTAGIYGLDDAGRCRLDPRKARGSITIYNDGYDEEETHEAVITEMRRGRLRAEPWLDLEQPFSLSDISRAFAAVADKSRIKALVKLAD